MKLRVRLGLPDLRTATTNENATRLLFRVEWCFRLPPARRRQVWPTAAASPGRGRRRRPGDRLSVITSRIEIDGFKSGRPNTWPSSCSTVVSRSIRPAAGLPLPASNPVAVGTLNSELSAGGVKSATLRRLERGALGRIEGDGDAIECQAATVVEDAAAQRFQAADRARVCGQAAGDGQIAQNDLDVALDLENTVNLVGVDDGHSGAGALDRLGGAEGGEVEIAGLSSGFVLARRRSTGRCRRPARWCCSDRWCSPEE